MDNGRDMSAGGPYWAQETRMAVVDQLALNGVTAPYSRTFLGEALPLAMDELEGRIRDLPADVARCVRATFEQVRAATGVSGRP